MKKLLKNKFYLETMRFASAIGICLIFTACGTEAPEEPPIPKPTTPKASASDTSAAPVGDVHDEEPPEPPPTGRPVVMYRDGKASDGTAPQAEADGLTVVDLSNYWVPFIFSEKDGEESERKPNDFRPIFRKLANDWHYESRTVAAAHAIVDKQRRRARNNKIFALRQEGLSDEQIRERMGLPETASLSLTRGDDDTDEGTVEGADETDDSDSAASASEDGDEETFEGGLGEADNFLEVYGIPPSLSVLRKRAVEEVERPCFQEVDFDAIRRFDGFIAYKSNNTARKESREGRRLARKMRDEMEKLGADTPEALRADPKNKLSSGLIDRAVRYEALAETQKALACEGLFAKGQENNYWSGGLDWKTHQALLAFEHKCRIFGWGFFGKDTLAALTKTPEERLFDAFVRVLQERLIDAAGIIEDGSVNDPETGEAPTYKDTDGTEKSVRNLTAELTAAALHHMDLNTPDKVVAFLKGHDDESLDKLFVALPLPALPPYYSEDMALHSVIDRGDVWYDYPYDSEGRHRSFPRKNMPTNTLYVKWNEQEIPLVRMNTTIGGWRTELAPDGYEYYKYKGSDVGERVWKDIVAGPVWLPPDTTPMKDLIKEVSYRGRRVKVPNYDEFGPWYASAYGLVAAFHVRPAEKKSGEIVYFDNGIRSHGSVDYNSILRRFSHGCHRLYNHMAIRLFDFVLHRKPFSRVGEINAGYSKRVTVTEDDVEETYVIDLKSKGYKFELKEPVPVSVLTGNVRGRQKTPIEGYMPKPEEEYGPDAQFLPADYLRASADAGVPDPAAAATTTPSDTAAPTATPSLAPAAPAATPTPATTPSD